MTTLLLSGTRPRPAHDGRLTAQVGATLEVCAVRRSGVFSLALVLCFAGGATAQVPAPAARAPAPAAAASPLDNYATAAATTIIAEQACPGVQVRAGQLTTLRLAARVNAGQEAMLEEKLKQRAMQVRQQLAADGREAWCSEALAAFGPEGSVAKGVLATGAPIR